MIELKQVSFRFQESWILSNLSMRISKGQSTALIGESGCGKTTCLRLMNGLLIPDRGEVLFEGKARTPSEWIACRRQMGYCLQGSTLFPHLRVNENLSLVARKTGWGKKAIQGRVEEVLELVQLNAMNFKNKWTKELSGGEKQRVSLARALFLKPQVLLMDEPFGALDPLTRSDIQQTFLKLQHHLSLTVVLVTHDLREAEKLSQDLVLMAEGHIVQRGAAQELRNSPASHYVQDFFSKWGQP